MTLATIQFDARYIDLILTEDISQDAVVVQGNIIGVALTSGVQGQKITVDLEGIKRLPAITSIALSIGEEVYWDTVFKHVTSTTTDNTLIIGTVVSNKELSGDEVDVKLHSFLVSGVSVLPGSVTDISSTIFSNKSIDANTTATGNLIINIGASEIEAGIITDQIAISALDGTESVLATSGSILGRATTQQIADLAGSSGNFGLINDTSPQLGGLLDLNGNQIFIDNTGTSGLNQLLEFRNINNDVSHLTIGNAISGGDVFIQTKGATNANLVLSGGIFGHVAIIDNVDEKRLEFHLDQAITNTITILDVKQTANRTITLPDASGTLALTSQLGNLDLISDTSPQLGGLLDLNGRLHFNDNTGASGENVLIEFANVNLDEAWLKISNATVAGDVILEVEGSDIARLVIASGADTNVNIGDKNNSKFIEFDLSDAQNSTTTTLKSSQQTNRTITLPDVSGTLALLSDLSALELVSDTSPQLGGLLDLNGRLHFNDNTGVSGENVLIEFANVDNDEAWLKISNSIATGDVILEVEGSDAARLVIAAGTDTNVTIGDKINSRFIDFDFSNAQNNTTTTIVSNQQTDRNIILPRESGTLALTSDLRNPDLINDTSPQLGGVLDTNGHQIRWSRGADVVSTTVLPLINDGNIFDVTGTTTINSLSSLAIGIVVVLHFTNVLTLTNSTSLILPGGENIITASGDVFTFTQISSVAWRCITYILASGTSIIDSDSGITNIVEDITPQLGGNLDTNGHQIRWSKGSDVTSALSITLGTDGNVFDIIGTTNIANMNLFTLGTVVVLHFTDILTLINSISFILPGGADITTASGDMFTFVQHSNITWRCIGYTLTSGKSIIVSGLNNIVEDITPQLGGDLDVGTHSLIDNAGNTHLEFVTATSPTSHLKITQGNDTNDGPTLSVHKDGTSDANLYINSRGGTSRVFISNDETAGELIIDTTGINVRSTILKPTNTSVDAAQLFLPSVDTTLVGINTSNTLTNKEIDASGSGNSITNIGKDEIKPGIITDQSTIATLADDDTILVYDTSGSLLGKATAKQIADLGSGGGTPATGDIELIRNIDFTTQSSIELTSIFTSTYTEYRIRLEFKCNQNNTNVLLDWSFNPVVAWFAFTKGLISLDASNTFNNFNNTTGSIVIDSAQDRLCTYEFKLFNPSVQKDHSIIGESTFHDSDSATATGMNIIKSWFSVEGNNSISGLRFNTSTGTITGNYTIFAVRA